jgi:probable HAF family extracellular repeat protein
MKSVNLGMRNALSAIALIAWSGCALAQTYSVTALTLGGTSGGAVAINSSGQVTGYAGTTGNTTSHAFLYSNGVMQDLGTLGGTTSEGHAINDSGQVTGNADTDGDIAFHAFLYSNNVMQDLGTLGGTASVPFGINSLGQVTGYAYTVGGAEHAFLYRNGVMQDLGTLGGTTSVGNAINDSGQIAGLATTAAVGNPTHAFLYSNGVMKDLGTLGGTFSIGAAVNSSGQVAGYAATVSGQHAFLYSNGVMQDLGTFGGNNSASFTNNSVNSAGQVTGYAGTTGNTTSHAFLYSNGVMQDLGTLGAGSAGYAINDSGQVVGNFNTSAVGNPAHAFLYSKGQMFDLTSLIAGSPVATNVTLTLAVAINGNGSILAYGTDNTTGQQMGYLLTPVLTIACPAATAQVGFPYSSALTAAGGIPPYTFSNTGNLPVGLTLNSSTGAITGTPGTAGPFSFTGKVVDSSTLASGTVTANCTLTVSAGRLQLSVTPTSLPFGTVRQFSLLLKTVTLKNTGTGAVSISKVSVTPGAGTDSDEFTPLSFCPSSLAVGKKCAIIVVFFADDLGSLSATLNIPNNAVESPQTVPLSATVIPRRS